MEGDVTKAENLYVGEQPGFTPQIGRLVWMMRYVRRTTLSDVAGLGAQWMTGVSPDL
jgi:hypothetical protein